jgi:Plasma-membrane choline transporter
MASRKHQYHSVSQDAPIVNSVIPSYGTETVTIDEPYAEGTPLVVSADIEKDFAPVCRDLPFAILFLMHLAIMIWLGIGVAPVGYSRLDFNLSTIEEEIRESNVTEEDLHHFEEFVRDAATYSKVYPERILLFLVAPCCILGFIFALICTVFVMKPFPKPMVYSTLFGSLFLTALVMISTSIASRQPMSYILTVLSLGVVVYYICIAWKMVPFAAVNLKVALEGISRNCGMYLVAFVFAEFGFLWVVYWCYVVIGVSAYKHDECQKAHPDIDFDDPDNDICGMPFPVFILFLLSLYWTSTVAMVST